MYFIKKQLTYTPKNKLQELAIPILVEKFDRMLLQESELEDVLADFRSQLETLSSEHNRCKKLVCDIGWVFSGRDRHMNIPGLIHFRIYEVTKNYSKP